MAKKSVVRKAAKPVKKAARKATKSAVKKPTKKAAKKKVGKSTVEKSTITYISFVPQTIPAGKLLCHGGVIPQTSDQKPATNGFRPWLDDRTEAAKYGKCNCGWSGLPHYMPLAWLENNRNEYDARKFPRK